MIFKIKNSDWTQPFDLQYKLTTWIQVELQMEYLRSKGGDSVDDTLWNLVVKPDVTVDRFVHQLAASLRGMSNKNISNEFNSFAVALVDNRPNTPNR